MEFTEFKILHSETIMFYQIIEHDIKLIYAYLHRGNPEKNYQYIEKETLGESLRILRKLDNEDGKPLISLDDYNFLIQISENRNEWAHSNYIEFMYEKDPLNSVAYKKQCEKLLKDHSRLEIVYRKVEEKRLSICKEFKRQ